MTTIVDPPPAAAPRPVRPYLQLERLEYGKYCLSRDGAIEPGIDHLELARTEGFPADVASQCDPEIIGVAHSTDEDPYAPAPYGTVIRPVRMGNRLLSVMGRVRMRPEDGENGSGRRYMIARYLVSPDDGPTPEQMLWAMNRQPLIALTRADVTASVTPVRIAQPGIDVPRNGADPSMEAFLRTAADYALSAVPVTITGEVDEETFFRWVTSLWHLAPASIRPLFSAGWNVAPSLSGELLITRSPAAASSAASYSTTTQRWTPPARVEIRRTTTRVDTMAFTEERLVPGRSLAFLHGVGSGQDKWFSAPPLFDFPPIPDLRDATTIRALRWPGLRLADDFRRLRVAQWFRGAAAIDLEQERAAGDFIYADTQSRALADLLAALAGPRPVRDHADEYVWRLTEASSGGWLRETLQGAIGPGAARGRLLLMLRGPATDAEAMNALAEATLADEAQGLPDSAVAAVRAVLDRHVRVLDETGTGIHRRLILSDHAPAEYRAWVRENEITLALTITKWPADDRMAALEALLRDGSPALQPFGRWLRGQPPAPGDAQVIATLPAEVRELFARSLASAWCHAVDRIVARRAQVLAWMAVEAPNPPESALLRFALGQDISSAADVAEIVADVERGYVPDLLNERLAVFAVARWAGVATSLRSHVTAWSGIVDWWPRPARRLLLDIDRESQANTPRPVLDALDQMQLPADEVEAMIERWSGWPERANDAPLGAQLWHFAATARVATRPRLRSVEIVHELVSHHLSGLAPVHAAAVARVLDLVAAARVATLDAAVLWPQATLSWQILLLLRIFPNAALRPSVRQLEALARDREEFDRYRPEITSQERFALLEILTLGFHSIDFRRPATTVWRDDYRDSFLWAVFSGVPLDQQGSLRDSLDFYTHDARARVDAIRTYLQAAAPRDRDEAAYRALRDGVFPLLARQIPVRVIVDALRLLNERRSPPVGLIERWRIRFDDVRRWITRRPVLSANPAPTAAVIRRGRRIIVADWLYELLRTELAVPNAVIERAGHDYGE